MLDIGAWVFSDKEIISLPDDKIGSLDLRNLFKMIDYFTQDN